MENSTSSCLFRTFLLAVKTTLASTHPCSRDMDLTHQWLSSWWRGGVGGFGEWLWQHCGSGKGGRDPSGRGQQLGAGSGALPPVKECRAGLSKDKDSSRGFDRGRQRHGGDLTAGGAGDDIGTLGDMHMVRFSPFTSHGCGRGPQADGRLGGSIPKHQVCSCRDLRISLHHCPKVLLFYESNC